MSRFRLVESAHDLGALASYHEFTREHQAHRLVCRLTHWLLKPLLVAYFSAHADGDGGDPARGRDADRRQPPLVPRPVPDRNAAPVHATLCFMGKAELFARPRAGWYLSRCGCFPVRRGESDPDAMETAR